LFTSNLALRLALVRLSEVPATFTSTVELAGAEMVMALAPARSLALTENTLSEGSAPVSVIWPLATVVVPFVVRAA